MSDRGPRGVVARWRALTPPARRSLQRHLARQLVIVAALYALIALGEHSWWRPALTIVAVAIVTAVGTRLWAIVRARRGRIR